MNVKLLTEHYLEFLSSKGGCTGSSKSIYTCQNATLLEITRHGSYGNRGSMFMYHWISSFLSARTQNVVLEGCSSGSVPVVSGVPANQFWWGRESWLLCLICLPGVS